MRLRLALPVLLLALAAGPALAQDLTIEERARIEGYVRLLGDESAEVRQSAERALVALGERVRPFVTAAASDPDAEVRRRARAVLERLKDAARRATGADLTWAGLRGGPTRSGVVGGELPKTEPTAAWVVSVPDAPLLQGAVVPGDGRVICLSGDGAIRCFLAQGGERSWLAHADSSIEWSAVLAAERLVVPTGRALLALDVTTGRTAWAHEATYGCNAAPAVVGGRVYSAFRNEGVRAYDLESGEKVFERKLAPSGALLADGDLIVTGTEDGRLMRLDPSSGKTVWSRDLGSEPNMGPTLAAPGVIVVLSRDRYLRALSVERGRELWSRRIAASSRSESLAAAAGRLFLTDRRGAVRAFDAGSGRMLWQRFEGLVEIGGPCATSKSVVYGSRGRLVCRDAQSGNFRWRVDFPALDNAVPVARDGRLYLLTNRRLHALE